MRSKIQRNSNILHKCESSASLLSKFNYHKKGALGSLTTANVASVRSFVWGYRARRRHLSSLRLLPGGEDWCPSESRPRKGRNSSWVSRCAKPGKATTWEQVATDWIWPPVVLLRWQAVCLAARLLAFSRRWKPLVRRSLRCTADAKRCRCCTDSAQSLLFLLWNAERWWSPWITVHCSRVHLL